MRTIRTIVILLAASALLLGCGDEATGPAQPQPQPGELRVEIASGTPVGSVVLTVTGTGITAPTASGGAALYHELSGSALNAVVVGSSLSGTILRFSVPDVRQVSGYQVSLQQASGTANQALAAGAITLAIAP